MWYNSNVVFTDTRDNWEEVSRLEFVISFVVSVAASIVAYYICKWLDKQRRKTKKDN